MRPEAKKARPIRASALKARAGWPMDKHMFDLDAALMTVIETEGSDLHLKVPAQPMVRRYGKLVPIEGSEPLRPEDTESTLFHMLTDEAKLEAFRAEHEVDFSYSVPGVARFRVNAFVQRGSVSLVCRAIPFEIKTVEELHAAAGDRRDRRRGARAHPAHRHHRLGQVDDARGDDRPHQHELREAHRHDRGPGRVPPPRQARRSSTSARSARTPPRSSARCAACCARTRT